MQQHVIFVEKYSQKSLLKIKIIEKLEAIAVLQENTDYEFHFIIKELANEFQGQFECLEVQNFFCSNRKKKLEKLIKMLMKIL